MPNSKAPLTDFQRSRIYAEGWNAARATSLKNDAGMKAPNPYRAEPQRSRWNEGFAQGLGKS